MRTTLLLFIVSLLAIIVDCGGDRYADLRHLLEQSYEANELYIRQLQSAASPQDIARALNEYSDRLEPLAPRIRETLRNYPEVNIKSRQYPAELEDIRDKEMEQEKRAEAAMTNLMRFMLHPEVLKAFQRFNGITMKMQ